MKVTTAGLKKMREEYESWRMAELEARSAFDQDHRNEEQVMVKLGLVQGDLEEAQSQVREL